MKSEDLTLLTKKYGPCYIARSERSGRLVDHDKDIEKLFSRVRKRKDVVIGWLRAPNTTYILAFA